MSSLEDVRDQKVLKNVTMTIKQATIRGAICSLPFILILGIIYRIYLIEDAFLMEIGGISFGVMFIAIIVISVFIHEILHGLGWAIASGQGMKVIKFNIHALMPTCACSVPLEKRQYLVGVLLPFFVLGFISIVALFVYPGTISVLVMAGNFAAVGADLVIALYVLKERDVLIMDHPTKAGYVTYAKSRN